MYYVYAISSQQRNYIYVGLSNNLKERFLRHSKGYERTTKPYKPFFLLYFEVWPDRVLAREREIFLKTTTGKRFLKRIKKQKFSNLF